MCQLSRQSTNHVARRGSSPVGSLTALDDDPCPWLTCRSVVAGGSRALPRAVSCLACLSSGLSKAMYYYLVCSLLCTCTDAIGWLPRAGSPIVGWSRYGPLAFSFLRSAATWAGKRQQARHVALADTHRAIRSRRQNAWGTETTYERVLPQQYSAVLMNERGFRPCIVASMHPGACPPHECPWSHGTHGKLLRNLAAWKRGTGDLNENRPAARCHAISLHRGVVCNMGGELTGEKFAQPPCVPLGAYGKPSTTSGNDLQNDQANTNTLWGKGGLACWFSQVCGEDKAHSMATESELDSPTNLLLGTRASY